MLYTRLIVDNHAIVSCFQPNVLNTSAVGLQTKDFTFNDCVIMIDGTNYLFLVLGV